MFWFSLQHLSATFLVIRIQRDIVTNVQRSSQAKGLEHSDRFHEPTWTTNLCNRDAVCFLRNIELLFRHYLGELQASNGQFTLYYRSLTVATPGGHSSGRSNIREGSSKWHLTHYLHHRNSEVCHLVQGMSNAMSSFTAQRVPHILQRDTIS